MKTTIFHTIADIKNAISEYTANGKTIGFVPTMGALHQGHLQLVQQAVSENDIVVVSIFVNPIQFNNTEDLEKYPRTLENDVALLEKVGCNFVFAPSVEEMYPQPDLTEFDFGKLDKVMEGKFRPGHFKGVAIVVKKLFQIITPNKAYFGEKDYQQLAIINKMVEMLSLPIQIIPCPIVRESDGLAMSSRNMRLTPDERQNATTIYEALCEAKEKYTWFTPEGVELLVTTQIEENPYFKVEYVEVVDASTLQKFEEWNNTSSAVICVAAFIGKVRLIDNVKLF